MATEKILYGSDTPFSLNSNLGALATATAKPLGVVDNSTTLAENEKIQLKITLNAAGVSATGTIEVYALASNDNSIWTDNISPALTTDVSASIKNAPLIGIFNANANAQVVVVDIDLLNQSGINPLNDVPKFWSLVIFNKSGATLPAVSAGNIATSYTPINYTVA